MSEQQTEKATAGAATLISTNYSFLLCSRQMRIKNSKNKNTPTHRKFRFNIFVEHETWFCIDYNDIRRIKCEDL